MAAIAAHTSKSQTATARRGGGDGRWTGATHAMRLRVVDLPVTQKGRGGPPGVREDAALSDPAAWYSEGL